MIFLECSPKLWPSREKLSNPSPDGKMDNVCRSDHGDRIRLRLCIVDGDSNSLKSRQREDMFEGSCWTFRSFSCDWCLMIVFQLQQRVPTPLLGQHVSTNCRVVVACFRTGVT